MLDLKELERRLDEALAKETKESLTEWLLQKRLKMLLQELGEEIYDLEVVFSDHDNSKTKDSGCPVPEIYEASLAA